MTAVKFIGGIIRGTSTERGTYTTTNLNAGWLWIESDTQLWYYWSGSAWLGVDANLSMTALGNIIYGGASGARTILAGNTTAVKQFLSQTGTGTVSAAPVWATPVSFGFFRGWVSIPSGTNSANYFNMVLGPTTTETNIDFVTTLGFTVTRFRAIVQSNTKNGNTIYSFRDDAADVTGTALTVGASTAGEFDSGALSVAVAAGSKIAFKVDTTASSSGTILGECIAEVTYNLQ